MYSKKPQGWMKHIDFIVLDILSLQIAFVLAYMTRHGLVIPYVHQFYINIAFVYTLVDFVLLICNNTMSEVLKRGYYKEMAQTVKHVFLVALVVSVYLFSTQGGAEYSRITFYLTAIYYVLIGYGVRLLWKRFLRTKKKDFPRKAIFFVTTADRAEAVIGHFKENDHDNAYLICGLCIFDEDKTGEEIAGIPVMTSREKLLDYLCDKWVDAVYISLPAEAEAVSSLTEVLMEMGIVVHVEMEQRSTEGWHQTIEMVGGATVRTLSVTMASRRELFMKRALDIVGGLVGCVITGILTLIIGPIIYIKSPGPIFFKQTRVGQNGKTFQMYKFRSMYPDAEARKAELMKENRIADGMMFKLEFDPRIIGCEKRPDGTVKKGIGNFIRDYSLDEFPQFFNVLKGDLSLCGTRPPTLDEWEKYELHHRARLAIKPGITGLWQVSGRSNITDFEKVVELDKKYIREWSMGMDLRILLQTIKVVLDKEGSM